MFISQEAITERKAVVGVIGLGYVGLPLVFAFGDAGFRVLGFDIDPRKVELLLQGESYIKHIDAARIRQLLATGQFTPTTDFGRLSEPDALLICVPTPLTENREPEMAYIEQTTDAVARTLRPGQLVVLESTTYPGTTAEVVLPRLQAGGLQVGRDFFLAFSPEREDPGNPSYGTTTIPKVVGGTTPACRDLAATLYAQAIQRVVPVSSTQVAELVKLLENIYRSVNIALVNELKVLCHRMGIDPYEVIGAAATKPFGYHPFYPGPGLGGHCIPIDPFYLTWKARQYDFTTRFIELAGEVNTSMPYYVVTRVMDALNERGRALKGAKVLVLGVAYKRDVDDMRESPALKIIDLLESKGAVVSYHDPYIPELPATRSYSFSLSSVPLTPETLAAVDCALIITDHASVDYDLVVRHAPFVVDSRNATARVQEGKEKVIPA
ncbi:MAG: nucleotide sugar dehydrogenase [Myxococcota bacterium]|jgi:UDP-N-acetyl-D-glucosamine dehydrogenase|nr:nucleotide sugar dehydrogenase [Myxococcota bacterium]